MRVAKGDASGVCVAIRVRPFVQFEEARGDQNVVAIVDGEPRIAISASDYRTFDHVFGPNEAQETVFSSAVTGLIDGIFDGYNATILAYGQTGSGKTYTMGTAIDFKSNLAEEQLGIIPRSVMRIYDMIEDAKMKAAEKNQLSPTYVIQVQFVEIYMDDIKDLLDESKGKNIFILEQDNVMIMKGARMLEVSSVEQLMEALSAGSKRRTVGCTKMNDQSSRSHAIFSIHLKITRPKIVEEAGDTPVDTETVKTKFHFVDLAGSECMDQTGAEGQTAKEGIDINMGLFHLGQVINALTSKRSYIPYRSCKLTRLLQDSLGGNSRTLMIACISPSSANERHSLGTLNYASNAKKIQNLVTKNVTSSANQEAYLRQKINELEAKIMLYESGKLVYNPEGKVSQSDLYKENMALTKERDALKLKVESLSALLDEKQTQIISMAHREIDAAAAFRKANGETNENEDPVAELAKKYIEQNQKLYDDLMEARKENEMLVRQKEHLQSCLANKYEVPDIADDNESSLPEDFRSVIKDIVRRRKMVREVTAKEEQVQLDVTQEDEEEEHADEEEAEDEEIPNAELSMVEQELDEIAIEAEKENQKDLSQLVQVNADINVYEKVIEKLVEDLNRQRIAEKMYDEKCRALSEQIAHAEKERDNLMFTMKNDKKGSNDKKELDRRLKEVSEKYEARIRDLKKEEARVRSLENSLKLSDKKREQTEAELRRHQEKLSNLQKTKDDLKRKMEQDNRKYQEQMKIATKQIKDLKSDLHKRDVDLNKLKNKDQKRIDELTRELDKLRLKQQQQPAVVPERKTLGARKVLGGVLNRSKIEAFLQKMISFMMGKASRVVLSDKRKMDMDALIKQRTEKQQELNSLKKRLHANRFTSNMIIEMQSQLDALQNDIDHLTKTINDHAAQIEDVKDVSFFDTGVTLFTRKATVKTTRLARF
uniref:Kinesin motor domain-containing protein n=2 Tax=Panagrolaimus sp. JU765 TaxID=591449 RepID=A0AC34QKA5_9BILA